MGSYNISEYMVSLNRKINYGQAENLTIIISLEIFILCLLCLG